MRARAADGGQHAGPAKRRGGPSLWLRVGVLALVVFASGGVLRAQPGGKKTGFTVSGKKWSEVFRWVTDLTGKPVVGAPPTGSLSYVGPKDKLYTVPEALDIINDALLIQKYYLLNTGESFRVIPADDRVDPNNIPRVTLEALPTRGRNELVSV